MLVRPAPPPFLHSPDTETAPRDAQVEYVAETGSFRPGEVLSGTFEVLSLLGRGGMSHVFEARDRNLARKVAVKALDAPIPGVSLQKEGQALAAITDPGVVAVHAWGQHRGIEFIVMERIYGIALDEHLSRLRGEQGKLNHEEIVDILLALADALAAVHRAGIAHCDVKPGNVMLCPGGRVVLMDFGIFIAEAEASEMPMLRGTPGYMAPEQITGDVPVGGALRCDLFALGVVGAELLLGRHPFGEPQTATEWADRLKKPLGDLRRLRPDAPAQLIELLDDLLAVDPVKRPRGAEDVAWRLRTLRGRKGVDEAGLPFSVLVVDDDPDVSRALVTCVSRALPHADVREAVDARQALQLIRTRAPHLMLLDLQLPGMSGIELCMHLRSTHQADRCRIVPISGNATEHDLRLLQQLGLTQFMPKGPDLPARVMGLAREQARLTGHPL